MVERGPPVYNVDCDPASAAFRDTFRTPKREGCRNCTRTRPSRSNRCEKHCATVPRLSPSRGIERPCERGQTGKRKCNKIQKYERPNCSQEINRHRSTKQKEKQAIILQRGAHKFFIPACRVQGRALFAAAPFRRGVKSSFASASLYILIAFP